MSNYLIGTDPTLRKTKTPTVTTLTAGVGFTAGTSTAIALGADPGDEKNVIVTMDGVTQHRSTYSVSGTTLTFDAAIPTGTAEIEATSSIPVSSVTVADDAVTLAKMASGTDGNIISYDSSGNPVAIATGTDGQVLHSAGAGAQPAFETLNVNTGWLFVSAATASSSSSIDFTGLATGHDFEIVVEHMIMGTDSVLDIRMGVTGPTYRSSGYLGFTQTVHDDPGMTSDVQTSGLAFGYTTDNADGGQTRGIIRITDPAASTETNMQCWSQGKDGTDFWSGSGGCYYNTAEAHTAVRLIPVSGNITSGEFYLYKRANA